LLRSMGLKKKLNLGSWFRGPLRALASLKGLRGTPFDPFGYAAVRREERALIGWYEQLVRECLDRATPDNLAFAQEIVTLPSQIRGYEQIKLASIGKVKELAAEKICALKQKLVQVC
jgi:indolepyruvate ferredoxin oxidoreductase